MDLNRDWPDPHLLRRTHKDLRTPLGTEQPETLALMNLTLALQPVAAATLHEGAMVVSYPYDGYEDGSDAIRDERHATPDDATFVHLAATYAGMHTTLPYSEVRATVLGCTAVTCGRARVQQSGS